MGILDEVLRIWAFFYQGMVNRPIIVVLFEWAGPMFMDLFACTAACVGESWACSNLTYLIIYLSYKLVVINKLIIRILIIEYESVISRQGTATIRRTR